MSFEDAIEAVLKHEGGYVNDSVDPGGETRWGISKRTYPHLDIRALTRDEAIEIYRRDWWDRYGYGSLPEAIGAKVFDLSINMGSAAAHRLLQRALASVGRTVAVDGALGPQTRGAVALADPFALLAALRSEAGGFYRELVARRPALRRFAGGWAKRAYS